MSAHLTSQTICLMLGFAVAACAPGQPSATGPAASNGLGASSSPAATQPQDLGDVVIVWSVTSGSEETADQEVQE